MLLWAALAQVAALVQAGAAAQHCAHRGVDNNYLASSQSSVNRVEPCVVKNCHFLANWHSHPALCPKGAEGSKV